ncbi:MAG: hypothetical protein PHI85_03580 [Victivallaceae bacterium]|nr:hypothetical protein [Victivallaceae bacterium]
MRLPPYAQTRGIITRISLYNNGNIVGEQTFTTNDEQLSECWITYSGGKQLIQGTNFEIISKLTGPRFEYENYTGKRSVEYDNNRRDLDKYLCNMFHKGVRSFPPLPVEWNPLERKVIHLKDGGILFWAKGASVVSDAYCNPELRKEYQLKKEWL